MYTDKVVNKNVKNILWTLQIRVIAKLPNSEQSYKGKVKTHKYIDRQNQSTDKVVNKNVKNILFINVWRKCVFDIYFTELGAVLTTVLPV
jgi:hypothetical protein